ncbi:30S ribosomal protein S1 [Candidatus Poriferisocius sp.]|uniref:30S ribosomal protein S1 n=1 Tax=Candidatus Poriferisocius sp. TaxID=3101276 RepID=UPI003B016F4C
MSEAETILDSETAEVEPEPGAVPDAGVEEPAAETEAELQEPEPEAAAQEPEAEAAAQEPEAEPAALEPEPEELEAEESAAEKPQTEPVEAELEAEESVVEEQQAEPEAAVQEPQPQAPPGDPAPSTVDGLTGGTIVSGTVKSKATHEVELDLGGGRIGVISQRYWGDNPAADLTRECVLGEVVNAAVLVREDHKGRIVLSRLWAMQQIAWVNVARAAAANEAVTGTITAVVKGGLSCDVGVRGFIPSSLIDVEPVKDLKALVGREVQCKVVEADQVSGRLVLSRKAVVRAEQRKAAKAFMETMSAGDEYTGKVVDLQDFGAFVDINGVRGLVHTTEMAWKRVQHPSEVVSVGDEVQVRVKSIQKPKQRVNLTMKLTADPLTELEVGAVITGRVTRLVDFGAFVAVNDGVEGLVHITEMAEYRVYHPEEIVLPGEEVWVKVLSVDRKRRRVDLSISQAIAG